MSFLKTQKAGFEYNSQTGNKTRETDPLGRTKIYTYAPNGIDLLEVRQVNGQSTDFLGSFTYNSQHRRLTATDAAGRTWNYTYNAQGQPLTVTSPPRAGITENRTITYTYDTNGYLLSVSGPTAGASNSFTYDGYGRVRTMTDSDGYSVTFDRDALDRVTRVTYPDNTYEQVIYNRLDAEQRRDRLGRWTQSFYDALRRVVAIRDPQNRTTTQQWCNCGSLDKVIDASQNSTSWDRDVQGRATKEIRADGSQTQFTYENTTSRLKQRQDAKGQIATFDYFLDDDVKQVTYTNTAVSTPTVSFTYDPIYNRPLTMIDGTGTTTYGYNPIGVPPALGAGRLATVDGPLTNDTVAFSYDELGRVVGRSLSGFPSTFSYDELGRDATQGSPLGNFTPTYDGVSTRLASLTYPNGQTTQYTYFPNIADQRLQEIKHLAPGGAILAKYDYTYDARGNIKTWTQQSGTNPAKVYESEYDPTNELTAATLKTTDPTPSILKRYGYAYDPAGNRASEQVDDSVMSTTFDNRNRIVSRQPGGSLRFKGTLNEAATVTVAGQAATVAPDNSFQGEAPVTSGTSNVAVAATDPSGNTRTNTYQVTESGSTASYTYDANGNLTGDGTHTYEWDGANRLTRVLSGAVEVARFTYDGLNRRAQKIAGGVTTSYVYDGGTVVEERTSSGGTMRYVQGKSIDEHLAAQDGGGAVTYYVADHLGSIVQVTNAAGQSILSREYDPYGNLLTGASQGGYAFTGREWDPETGLYYYRARYYSARDGRFISDDPIGLQGDSNFYRYVLNSPLVSTDPTGLDVKLCVRQAEDLPEGVPHTLLYPTSRKTKTGPGTGPCLASGFGPKYPGPIGPGVIHDEAVCDEYGNQSPAYSCPVVSTSNCVEDCVERKIKESKKKPPRYQNSPRWAGGFQCSDWTDKILEDCRKECVGK